MKKLLLIAVLLLSAGFQSFANGSEVTSQPKPSKVILFVDFEKVQSQSDEWNYLQAQSEAIEKQISLVREAFQALGEAGASEIDYHKLDESHRLLDEADRITTANLKTLELPRSQWKKEAKMVIRQIAKELKAGAVVHAWEDTVFYVDQTNDITNEVIAELNKEYQQNKKMMYPTCDFSPFANRMNAILNRMHEIGSVRIK